MRFFPLLEPIEGEQPPGFEEVLKRLPLEQDYLSYCVALCAQQEDVTGLLGQAPIGLRASRFLVIVQYQGGTYTPFIFYREGYNSPTKSTPGS